MSQDPAPLTNVGPQHDPGTPLSFAEILAALGLPADARAVVITPTTAHAIAADYPEPYSPTEDPDGE